MGMLGVAFGIERRGFGARFIAPRDLLRGTEKPLGSRRGDRSQGAGK